MNELPKIKCDKCEDIISCSFGLIGNNIEQIPLLFILHFPDRRVNQSTLLKNEGISNYELALKRTTTGKILSEILTYCNLNFENTIVTNLFKGILKKDRNPHKEEYINCIPNLMKQIKELKPHKIIAFGSPVKNHLSKLELKIPIYYSQHPSYIWAKTIKYENRISYYQKIKNFIL